MTYVPCHVTPGWLHSCWDRPGPSSVLIWSGGIRLSACRPSSVETIILKADRAEWRWMWEQLTENLDPKVTTVNPSYYPSPAVQRHLVCSPSQVTIAMPYEALSLFVWQRSNFKRESCSWNEPVLKNFHFRKYSHVGQKIHKERMPGGSLEEIKVHDTLLNIRDPSWFGAVKPGATRLNLLQ